MPCMDSTNHQINTSDNVETQIGQRFCFHCIKLNLENMRNSVAASPALTVIDLESISDIEPFQLESLRNHKES